MATEAPGHRDTEHIGLHDPEKLATQCLGVSVTLGKIMIIREIWRRITPTRYARALEEETARLRAEIQGLRAENRALLNSILGIAGVPPIPTDIPTSCAEPPRITHPAPRPGLEAPPSRPGTSSGGRLGRLADGGVRVTAPLRRRSWQQINRMLEFESAKKVVASD